MLTFFNQLYQKYKLQVLGLILSIIGLFFAISIISYNEFDSSLNISSNAIILNWAGKPGSYVADFFWQHFGYTVILLIFSIFCWSIKLAINNSPLVKLNFVLLIISLFFASAILDSFNFTFAKNRLYGGVVGLIIHKEFMNLLGGKFFFYPLIFCFVFSYYYGVGIDRKSWAKLLLSFFQLCTLIIKLIWKIISKIFTFRRKENIIADNLTNNEDTSSNIKTAPKVKLIPKENIINDKANYTKKEHNSFILPYAELLKEVADKKSKNQLNDAQLEKNCIELKTVLEDFGINGEIIAVHPGPVVNLYELEPAAGTKSSRVIGLADDIARYMLASSARIAVIPGRNAIGIELPNKSREIVFLRELLDSQDYYNEKHSLPLILGKDIAGKPIIADLTKMPHLLVAGTTGSGKSVAINTMILSLLYRLTPDQCKFIMIDPKMLELSVYDGIPHLLTPVVTDPHKAIIALKWVVKEMENRYRLMSNIGVRNIYGYNERIKEALARGEKLEKTVQTGYNPELGKPIIEKVPFAMDILPFIVVIVDEMADLMLVAGKDIETSIQRLAQMARAAGIHIIMATQRPSVDVITGVIKANFPTRISFQVTSRIDSRTILGEQGAENLLGMGDMLYMVGGGRIIRIHGPYVSDGEVEKVVHHLKQQGEPSYIDEVTIEQEDPVNNFSESDEDEHYAQALDIVRREGKASTSFIQRHLKIGYNRAASIIERMEREGIVSKANHVGKREILV